MRGFLEHGLSLRISSGGSHHHDTCVTAMLFGDISAASVLKLDHHRRELLKDLAGQEAEPPDARRQPIASGGVHVGCPHGRLLRVGATRKIPVRAPAITSPLPEVASPSYPALTSQVLPSG